jgi:hypothetical protein
VAVASAAQGGAYLYGARKTRISHLALNTSFARMRVIGEIAGGSDNKQQQVFLYCQSEEV